MACKCCCAQTSPRRSSLSLGHTVLRYQNKCNSVYSHKKTVSNYAPIFKKPYVQISCAEFHPNRTIRVEITDKFIYAPKQNMRRLLRNSKSLNTFLWTTTYLLTYLLTPWSRVLLEKLTGSAASQEIPRIFGTRRFLTVLISARQLSLS